MPMPINLIPLNKLSEPPVESSFGYHVMKVEKRAPAPLETVKAQVKASLTQASLSEFAQKELPGLIETNNLPTPTPEPTAAPSASPAVSPAASPAISPSASPAAK
jgi:foldase protein PrsA